MTTLVKSNKTRYPWLGSEFSNFFGEDDFFNDRFWHKNILEMPAVNVIETEKSYLVEMAAPGLSREDFEITIDNGYLNIIVDKCEEMDEIHDDYTRKEFCYDTFRRSLLLPKNIIEEKVKAKYENGVLNFRLTKKVITKEQSKKRIVIE